MGKQFYTWLVKLGITDVGFKTKTNMLAKVCELKAEKWLLSVASNNIINLWLMLSVDRYSLQ